MAFDIKYKDKSNKSSIYVPEIARINKIQQISPTEKIFDIVFEDDKNQNNFNFEPGQFVELTVFGLGEAPFSICSNPENKDFFQLCIRDVGNVSGALHRMKEGSKIIYGVVIRKNGNHNILIAGILLAPLILS